jgi:hypothetical protein
LPGALVAGYVARLCIDTGMPIRYGVDMFRDDYIIRMIRQFGQIIAYIAGLRTQQRYPLALIAIDDAYRNRLGLGSDAVAGLSERELLALIRFGENDDTWRDEGTYIAALLYAEAAIYQAQAELDRMAPRAILALQLVIECSLNSNAALPEFLPDPDDLRGMLLDVAVPVTTWIGLIRLYEQEQAFDRAEDLLFYLLDGDPHCQPLIDAGLAFGTRLQALDDHVLAAGGLPRAEVAELLAQLQPNTTTA